MSDHRRRRFPSATFVGALLGVVCALLVQPPMMLTSFGTVAWLLVWGGSGLVAGAAIEAIVGRFVRSVDA